MARKKKSNRGGAREGAGRKPTGKAVKITKYVRCTEEQAEALDEHMEGVNTDEEAAGLPLSSFSKWSRNTLLREAGREDLADEE